MWIYYIYICKNTIYIYIYISISNVYIYRECIYIFIYLFVYVHIYIYIYMHMHMHMYMYMYRNIAYTIVYIYIQNNQLHYGEILVWYWGDIIGIYNMKTTILPNILIYIYIYVDIWYIYIIVQWFPQRTKPPFRPRGFSRGHGQPSAGG
jgi:hypothetical protein